MSKSMFLLGCIPIRLLLAYIAHFLAQNENYKNYKIILSLITFIIGLSFFIIYTKGWRKVGLETEGRPIWWNDFRPIHGVLFISFSILNLFNVKNSWLLLLLDVILGLIAFSNHYYIGL